MWSSSVPRPPPPMIPPPHLSPESPTSSSSPKVSTPTSPTPISLKPSNIKKKPSKPKKILKHFKNVYRSFPIIEVPTWKIHVSQHGKKVHNHMTGTFFGYHKAKVSLAIQDSSKSLPILVLELPIKTGKLLQDIGNELTIRVALECEKKKKNQSENDNNNGNNHTKTKNIIVDEPVWDVFVNGKKSGFGVKREASEEDLYFMQRLHGVSMGAGAFPLNDGSENLDADMKYLRAQFERVVGSKDSETYYMVSPEENYGPDLTIFFVRV